MMNLQENITDLLCRTMLALFILIMPMSNIKAQNSIDLFLIADSLELADKLQDAEPFLTQLSRENPYHAKYQYSLGELYYNKKAYKESISSFRRAQDLGIIHRSNYYLACNYTQTKQYDSAVYFLSEHFYTPMNGDHPYEGDVLSDSIFSPLRTMPEYIALLPPKIVDTTNVSKRWIADITYLSAMLRKTHFDPYIQLSKPDWDQEINKLIAEVPALNDDQIYVRIALFVKMIGDGHTRMLNSSYNRTRFKKLPIATKLFADGCYIVSASEEYEDLLGARIVGVEGMEFAKVFEKVCSVIAIDNVMNYRFLFDWEFRKMNILHGLGICKSIDSIFVEYEINGKIKSRSIDSFTEENIPELLGFHVQNKTNHPIFLECYRKGNLKWYWYKYLENDQIFYFQLNAITSLDDDPLPKFCDSLKAILETKDISAFVLDLRNNGGGNTKLNKYILEILLSESVNIKGRLFTVIGPNTFSAAQNLTTVIENYTEAIFIGEPTGSKPHFIGEINPIKLPFSGMLVSSSNVFHQHGYSTDTRNWIPPDIYVDLAFQDYKNGIDPVMEEIKEYLRALK